MSENEGILRRYWKAYGGFKALFTSYYLYMAITLTVIMAPAWLESAWYDTVLSVMPNVLGFSLGGYALLIAIGDENFRSLISGEDEDGVTSPYMEVNASFVHFILMQILALILALIANAYAVPLTENAALIAWIKGANFPIEGSLKVLAFLGYFVFLYALLTAIAATLSILRVSSWYDAFCTENLRNQIANEDNEQPPQH
jgi:hypothetical protein